MTPEQKLLTEQLEALRKNKAPAFAIKLIEDKIEQLKDETDRWLDKLITQHPSMLELKEKVYKLAPLDYPVMIIGESGTGKELIAKALHGNRKGKFVPINCSGLAPALVESELFGHTKGAFTGSVKDRTGLMIEAENGTLFLDEIGDFPFELQPRLLRAIQEKKVRPVGTNEEIPINCRIISATHKPLDTEYVKLGLFRDDLFYRISTFILRPTALKDRMKDIPFIVKALFPELKDLETFCTQIKPEHTKGNVRSLEQLVIRYKVYGEIEL